MGSKQTQFKTARRYRINPLELVIFLLVTTGFGYSVFHLFRDADEMHFATLQPMQTQPTRKVPERSIASVSGTFDGVAPMPQRIQIEVNCAENPGFKYGDQVCPNLPDTGRVLDNSPRHNPALPR